MRNIQIHFASYRQWHVQNTSQHLSWLSKFLYLHIRCIDLCQRAQKRRREKTNTWRAIHLSRIKYSILKFLRKNFFSFRSGFPFWNHTKFKRNLPLSDVKIEGSFEKSERILRFIAWLMERGGGGHSNKTRSKGTRDNNNNKKWCLNIYHTVSKQTN